MSEDLTQEARYGIFLYETEDGQAGVTVQGEPDLGQLQRLLAAALANLQADIVANKVVAKMAEAKRKKNIVLPEDF